jgi:predicted ferric reductase
MHFVRRSIFEVFLGTHLWLAVASISTLVWHVLPGSLWMLLRLLNSHLNKTRRIWARLDAFPNSQDLRLCIRLRRQLAIKPGQYFYIQFCNIGFPHSGQSHPFMVTWLDEQINELHFLIQPQNGLSGRLRNDSKPLVTISGPYGQDLNLERYENVLLFAEGIGISGLLPYVQHLSERKTLKDSVTKRVNLYWFLEDNHQIEWVKDYFDALGKFKVYSSKLYRVRTN